MHYLRSTALIMAIMSAVMAFTGHFIVASICAASVLAWLFLDRRDLRAFLLERSRKTSVRAAFEKAPNDPLP
jgi:hypothetical protein